MTNGNDKSLESWIWDAVCSIRGAKDAPKFKDYSDTASSDIDVLVLSDHVDYADVFEALQSAEAKLGRTVNPTVQRPADWRRKRKAGAAFAVKVMAQPKLFLIGSEKALD